MKKKSSRNTKEILSGIFKRLYSHFGPQHWWPGDSPFEVMVGAILTQNTNWQNVSKAITNLKKQRVLSAEKIHRISISKLASLIKPAGYFNVKAKRLKNFLEFFMTGYQGSIRTLSNKEMLTCREELLQVNGIGPETADSMLLYALNKPMFVVDAYTKRILSRHNLIKEDASYDGVQRLFMEHLPNDLNLFNEYHALIVRLGKDICKTKPLCNICPLKNEI